MKTPEQFIKENYSENWLKNQWESGDVLDALKEYAESLILINRTSSGWECPRCHKIHAIWVSSCDCTPRIETACTNQAINYHKNQ